MSVRMLARVWDCSRHAGNDLLMLLAIADFADDDGRAYPSVARLAEKCRMTPRNVNLILAQLRQGGELKIRQNEGPKGTNLYLITLKDSSPLKDSSDTPEETFPKPLKKSSDKPSVNRQEPSTMADGLSADSENAAHCPHQQIIDAYHELLPTCTPVKVWNDQRRKLLRQRWRESEKRHHVEWWRKFFAYVAQSRFLTGQAESQPGRDPFVADLEWLLRPLNFAKVIEGKYHREAA